MMRAILPLAACILYIATGNPARADHPVVGGGVSHGAPIVTIAADTLPQGALAGGIQVSYIDPDSYTDEELIALASQHVHAHTADYTLLTTATLSYGVTGHFTLSASVPYLRRDNLRAGEHSHSGGMATNTVERLGSVSGIGDASIIGQYQFAHSHEQGWGVALVGGMKMPTGATHRKSNHGDRLETEHQPGTGSWDPILGLAASRRWGPVSLDANALYEFSTKGAQETELGDRSSINAALSYNLAGATDHHAHGGDVHGHASWTLILEANGEWEGRQKIAGEVETDSGSQAVYLSPGIRFGSARGWSLAMSAGLPVWQEIRPSHPDNRFRLVAQVGSTF